MHAVAFGLYILFIISWFLHLAGRVPLLGLLRVDLVLAITIFVLTLLGGVAEATTPGEQRVRRWLKVLILYVAVTLPLVQWPGTVLRFGLEAFIKAAVFYLFTAQLVTTTRRLKILTFVFIACQTFRVLEPLYLHVTEGYWGSSASMANWEYMDRLSGAPNDVVNPNGLAFVILTALAFGHFILTGVLGRLFYLAALPAHLYALVLTASRSGFVVLIGMYAVIWWRSRHKLVLTAAAALVVVIAAPRLSENAFDRYRSIFTSDAKNAGTAEGRINSIVTTFEVALRRPLFGHGLGTSREAGANFGGSDQPAHNLYTETAQELGFIGLAIVVALIFSTVRSTAETLRAFHASSLRATFPARVAASLQVFLAMNLLFSLASYGLTSYEWYLMAGLSEVLARMAHGGTDTLVVPSQRPEARLYPADAA